MRHSESAVSDVAAAETSCHAFLIYIYFIYFRTWRGPEVLVPAPSPGMSAAQRWAQKCPLAAEQVAAGAFDVALRLLNRYD